MIMFRVDVSVNQTDSMQFTETAGESQPQRKSFLFVKSTRFDNFT